VFSVGEQLGIQRVLSAQDLLVYEVPDTFMLLTYVSQFYYLFHRLRPTGAPPRKYKAKSAPAAGTASSSASSSSSSSAAPPSTAPAATPASPVSASPSAPVAIRTSVTGGKIPERNVELGLEKRQASDDTASPVAMAVAAGAAAVAAASKLPGARLDNPSRNDDDNDDGGLLLRMPVDMDEHTREMMQDGVPHVGTDGVVRYLVASDLPPPLDLSGFLSEMGSYNQQEQGGALLEKRLSVPAGTIAAEPAENLCSVCEERISLMERVVFRDHFAHKWCFACAHCSCQLLPSTYRIYRGYLFCQAHYSIIKQIGIPNYRRVRDRHLRVHPNDMPPGVDLTQSLDKRLLKKGRTLKEKEQEKGKLKEKGKLQEEKKTDARSTYISMTTPARYPTSLSLSLSLS